MHLADMKNWHTDKNTDILRRLESAAEIKFAFADIDYKDVTETPEQVGKNLKTLKIEPSRIHHTGNGVHLLWSFGKVFSAHDDRVTEILKNLCIMVGGDPHVCHPAALLRMPGTHNSKFNQWKPVTVSINHARYP
jgi:hypothetical protein